MGIEALIDADIVAYRCAFTCEEDESSGLVLYRVNELMERILADVGATTYTAYISGGENFRKNIDPEYKANRKDKAKPKWLEVCKEYLVTEWNAKVTDGIEADDALGIHQTMSEGTIICSIDKDLLQVPGMHYNFVKMEKTYISEEEGLKRFWMQTLVGDRADNVFGVEGLGPVKSARILDPIAGDSLEELNVKYYETVAALYDDRERLHRNCQLLWVLRGEGQQWSPPYGSSGQKAVKKVSLPLFYEVVADDGLPSTSV